MNIYFRENIRRMRKQRDLTQEALADFLGVSFQAVSKWERGESYPDFELLPVIADFFAVSIDGLLGVDKAKNEKEILAICEKFDKKQYAVSDRPFGYFMKDAYKKYPADFRIAVRYMQYLQALCDTPEDTMKHTEEITAIYNRIQNYCTDDPIRIHAKYLILHHYRNLARIDESPITYADIYRLLDTLPSIKETKDYLLCYMHEFDDKERIREGCRELIDRLLLCLDDAVSHFVLPPALNETTMSEGLQREMVAAFEKMKTVYETFYPDGVFGRSWRRAIYIYGYLGQAYHYLGDDEKALSDLKKCAELAKRFDALPDETERHSFFFAGTTYKKSDDDSVYADTSLCKQMTRHMTKNYPLSDEFKARPEFREILDIMK
ncbi:MAG: helix-turn-helix transcriptional regulator [Clostridia bacterium]|nr:helix-turn-helix transcriptional regulator [Clostridia bacterium]